MSHMPEKGKGSGFDQKQQIQFLKKIDFFDNFDNHELKQFLAVSRWLKIQAGKRIIRENTRERAFYILVKGAVSVYKTMGGKKKPIKLTSLSTGACFGEMSLVMDVKRTADVVSDTECFILMVEPGIINTSNVFLQLKFYKRFCEVLVSRLIDANEKMADHENSAPPQMSFPGEHSIRAYLQSASSDSDPTASPSPQAKENTLMVLPPLPDKKDRMVKSKIRRTIKTSMELAFNPFIADKLVPLLQGECSNTRIFADLIQLDPTLSCKVLQISNSTYFRRSTPIATVAHSLITVGIKQIQEALAEIIETTDQPQPFSGFHTVSSSFWQHSIIVARIADLLKEVLRINLSSDVYLAGLFHDIGILALDQIEPKFYPQLIDPNSDFKGQLTESEIAYIGIDHGQAGCWFGESSGLPQAYLDVIHHHHEPQNAKSNSLLVGLIHLADLFAMERNSGVGEAGYQPDIVKSFGWTILQDQHRPFLDVHLPDFLESFNKELDNTWSGIVDDLDFSSIL